MEFYTVRDLRSASHGIWESLSANGEVVITNNGKPTALMINIQDGSFDQVLKTVKQARSMMAFNKMRTQAAESGFLDDKEIEAEIAAYRAEKRNKQQGE